MLFDQSNRFQSKATTKDDGRDFVSLPSIVTQGRNGLKMVDPWKVPVEASPSSRGVSSQTSLTMSSRPIVGARQEAHDILVGTDSPGPLAYNTVRSSLSTKGAALSQLPQAEVRTSETKAIAVPGPGAYEVLESPIAPSHNLKVGAAGNSKHVQLQRHLHHRQLIHGKKPSEPSQEPTKDAVEPAVPEEHLPRSTSNQRRLLKMQLRQMLSVPTNVDTGSSTQEDERSLNSGMEPGKDANDYDSSLQNLRLLASTLAAEATESATTSLTSVASLAK